VWNSVHQLGTKIEDIEPYACRNWWVFDSLWLDLRGGGCSKWETSSSINISCIPRIDCKTVGRKEDGYLIPWDELDGSLTSDVVADSIRLVMVENEGRIYREKIKEVKDLFVNVDSQERYIDELLHYLRRSLYNW